MAIKAFEIDYGANCPKAVAKIVDHADVLLEFYRYPAERWIHLHHEPDRMHFRDGAFAHQDHQRPRVSRRRSGDGLQSLLAFGDPEGPMVRTGLACLVL